MAIVALVFVASSRSTVAAPGVARHEDKVVHFAVYGLIGTLVCRAARPGWGGAVTAVVIVSAYGAADEWHQSFVPGRSSDLADWVADTLGGATAAALYMGWGRYRGWLEQPVGWKRGGAAQAGVETAAPAASVARR